MVFNWNRSIFIEEISKGWMFFIENDMKSNMKPKCSVTQSSAMSFAHPYKEAIADVLSGKNIFSTVDPSHNGLWGGTGFCLI